MATSIAGGASTSRQCNPKMPEASSFSKTGRYRVPSTMARRQQFSWRSNQQELEPLPRGLSTAVANTTSRPPSSRTEVSAPEGARRLGRSSKDLNRRSCPDYPARPGGVIDRMRHWSIVGSVGPLHGPGRQRSHASAGQPGRPEGEDQLGPTTSHLGPCCRRTFLRTRRTNEMSSTNSLRLRRRHHRLPGIHCNSHSDRRAATLRGSRPVTCEWTSDWAGVTRS